MLKKIKRIIKKTMNPSFVMTSKAGNAIVFGFESFSSDRSFKELWENYLYDIERYLKFSTTVKIPNSFENIKARITAHYHVIEKGLALRDTRLGYGKDVINSLVILLERYVQNQYPVDNEQFISALKTLDAYCQFHVDNGYDVQELQERISKYQQYICKENDKHSGGVKTVLKKDILDSLNKDFEHLAYSRHSIRDFAQGDVDTSLIEKAIKIAQKSPSVCNRQSSFVYIITNNKTKQDALSCQNGNRGFGHLADKLLIVTANLRAFYSIEERNQAFVDGGMFGMSLIYALHSLGLGTCTLNWSASKERDIKLRELVEIKEEEVVIFMVAVGLLPEKLNVAYSQRKRTEEIVKILD
jgi:nitroreductase